MKVQIDVFKSEEDMKTNSSSILTFSMESNAPYPFPVVGDEFKKEFVDKVRDEFSRNIYGNAPSQSVTPADTVQDALRVDLSCETSEWDCRKGSFTVRLRFPRRHALLNYNNDDSMSLTDCSTPDEIFYLKGIIKQ